MAGWNYALLIILSCVLERIATLSEIEEGNEKELRSMLRTVMEQNRRLSLQNARLQQVWHGLQQMCQALNERQNNIGLLDTTLPPTPVTSAPKKLRVLSVASSGVVNDEVNISVKYEAPESHSTEWLFVTEYYTLWRTPGKRSKHSSRMLEYKSAVYLDTLNTTYSIYFLLYNDMETIKIEFNLTELSTMCNQTLMQPLAYWDIKNEYYLQHGLDLHIPAVVNKDVSEFGRFGDIEISFTGINVTSSPPKVFEVFDSSSTAAIDVSGTLRNNTTHDITISLRYQYVENGGILSVRMPYKEPVTGLVQKFHYGPLIQIKSKYGQKLFTEDEVGIYHLPEQTFIYPPKQSIPCIGVGNTAPEVSIWKIKNGKLRKLPMETTIHDSFMKSGVYTVSSDKSKKKGEQFVCRVTDRNKTVETQTEVIFVDPVKVDDDKTGVMKNTSKGVLISCKASGKPRPVLQFRLYHDFGPDLIQSNLYKARISSPSKSTSRVAMWLSPKDIKALHTVYCVADQDTGDTGFSAKRKIEVFPGSLMENDWDLFTRIEEQAASSTNYSG